MKKIMSIVVTIIMMMVMAMPVMAGAQTTEEDVRVKSLMVDFESDFYESVEEEPRRYKAVDFSIKDIKLGNGIHDIIITQKIYNKYVYEFHYIYDAVEDEELTLYGVYEGKRYDVYTIDEMIETRFPELM